MTGRLLLHIGMNKAGSTSLQNALAKTGAGPGWRFLSVVDPNASNAIRIGFGNPTDLPHWSKITGVRSRQDARQALDHALRQADAPLNIISGEVMRVLHPAGVTELLDACRAYGHPIEALAYVRDPISFVVSSYQQHFKGGYRPLDQLFLPHHFKYRATFEHWDKALGREAVTLVPYQRDRLVGGSVVTDFAGRLDLGRVELGGLRANVSLSGEAVRLLTQYRRRNPDLSARDGRIVARLGALGGAPFELRRTLLEPARHTAEPVYQWAEERMGWQMPRTLPEAGPRAIGSEDDFDDILPETIDWLAGQTRKRASTLRGDMDAVADAVKLLSYYVEPSFLARHSRRLANRLQRLRR